MTAEQAAEFVAKFSGQTPAAILSDPFLAGSESRWVVRHVKDRFTDHLTQADAVTAFEVLRAHHAKRQQQLADVYAKGWG